MPSPQLQDAAPGRERSAARPPAEYPVREYIAGMSHELAQMARWDGDEVLAGLLEVATKRAEGPRP
jgi:hypothetical protein